MNETAANKPRILIVDDQQANIKVLAEVLQPEYDVSFATGGEEALNLLEEGLSPDMILLDIVMPEMDGFNVCLKIKSNVNTSHIPVIFVTSMDDAVNEELGFNLGAVDYILKPISAPIVKARVSVHLQLAKHREFLENLLKRRTDDLAKAKQEAKVLFDWIQENLM